MKIAAFADIHGNHIAFEACLGYCEENKIERFIFLGDYLGEMPKPEITMELLYGLKERKDCRFIRGNKENYWISYRKGGGTGWKDYDSTTGSLYYTYNRLTMEDIDFFEAMKERDIVSFEPGKDIECRHVPPYSIPATEEVYAASKKEDGAIEAPFLLCGHRHIQGAIAHEGRLVINPGSVGVPVYSQGKTQFAVLSERAGNWSVEYISLPYDRNRLVQEMYEEELDKHAPYWMQVSKYVVEGGNVPHAAVIREAMEICRRKYGECVWPDIPEDCYAEAFDLLIR